jgi:hypothetical protein
MSIWVFLPKGPNRTNSSFTKFKALWVLLHEGTQQGSQSITESIGEALKEEMTLSLTPDANPLSKNDARTDNNGNRHSPWQTNAAKNRYGCAEQPKNNADKYKHS